MELPSRPGNIGELRERIASGRLRESRVLEFKSEFPKNRALVKQLVGFAADGGVLVIGVAETDSGLQVTPIDCKGARERVEQIARDIPQPPVQVESHILDADTSGLGVLWIEIPASPHLAHEVDGTYYARDDTQTRPMRDPEVADRMALRRDRPGLIRQALNDALEREQPSAPSLHGRTCVVAQPIGASSGEFYERTRGPDVWESFAYASQPLRGFLPPVPHRYWGQISHRFAPPPAYLRDYRDIELQESGAFCYLSYSLDWSRGDEEGVFPHSALRACRDAISLINAVQDLTKQRRMWDLAFSISDVEGRTPWILTKSFKPSPFHLPIPRNQYSGQVLGVSTERLEDDPRAIVWKLAGRFVDECGFEFDDVWSPTAIRLTG